MHETTPQRTHYIPQPKCKEGNQTEIWCKALRNISDKKSAVQPLTQGMTVPRHQSWSLYVSFEVAGGDWVGTPSFRGMQLLSCCCCFMSCSDQELSLLGELEGVRRRQVGSLKPRQGKTSPVLPAGDLHHAPPH